MQENKKSKENNSHFRGNIEEHVQSNEDNGDISGNGDFNSTNTEDYDDSEDYDEDSDYLDGEEEDYETGIDNEIQDGVYGDGDGY